MLSRILSLPFAYRAIESLLISERSRREIFTTYVQASPGQRVLDLGCGPGTALRYLPLVDYVGIDVNPAYIDAARGASHDATFICGSFQEATRLQPGFDRVLAIGLLHHLSDDEVLEMLRLAHRLLARGGMLVTVDGFTHPDQSWPARFLLARDRGGFVRDRDGYLSLLGGRFDEVVVAERHDLLRLPYSHLILQARR